MLFRKGRSFYLALAAADIDRHGHEEHHRLIGHDLHDLALGAELGVRGARGVGRHDEEQAAEREDEHAQQEVAAGEEGEAQGGDEAQPQKEGENGKAQKTPTVNAYGRDLTALARQGALDPVIGRARELRRIVQIL